MLSQGQTIILTALVAIFSGFAVVGMFVMAVVAYFTIVGDLEHIWYPLMFFTIGGIGGAAALRFAIRKHQKDVAKQIGLD